jgi:TolB-like protein/Tfp pilus assembly protein PilF
MSYVEGQSLSEKIESGPLEMREALDIAHQIGQGLSRAHEQGIVHRDIKPANVLLTAGGHVKIVDFGLAKLATQSQLTRTGTTMGTVAYMSPEQAKAEEVDHRTDIWALGVVLSQMLTGELPFRGENEQTMIHAILKRNPRAISSTRKDVSIGVERVVDKALAKNPEKRYPEVDRLLSDLETQIKTVKLGEGPGRFVGLQRLLRKRSVMYGTLGVVAALGLAISIAAYQAQATVIDSLAVLPLTNLSGDAEQDYFVDGMTEALINELGKIHDLRVISRTSIMQFKQSDLSVPEIAKALNVKAIVEGSVLRSGDTVRISAQLVRAEPEEQLWAETYNRDPRDVVTLLGEVAGAITGAVEVELTEGEAIQLARARPVNPEAHDAVLKAKYWMNEFTEEYMDKALIELQKAIAMDPTYALAYATLGTYYMNLSWGSHESSRETGAKAKSAVMRALELDSSLDVAWETLGMIKFLLEWNRKDPEADFEKARELNPNNVGAMAYYCSIGRFDKCIELAERAVDLDPISIDANRNLGWALFSAGRYDESIEQLQTTLEMRPRDPITYMQLAWNYGMKEMYEETVATADSALALSSDTLQVMLGSMGWVYGKAGDLERALKLRDRLLEMSRNNYLNPASVAEIYVGLGEIDSAMVWLERGYEEHSFAMMVVEHTPTFGALRDHPDFQDLMRRTYAHLEQ